MAPLFEQGVVATDGAVLDLYLTIAIATDLISAAMEGYHPGRLAWQVDQRLDLRWLDQPPPATAEGLKRCACHGPSPDRSQNTAPPD